MNSLASHSNSSCPPVPLPTLADVLSGPRRQRSILVSVRYGRTLHGKTDGGRDRNALLEVSWMELTGCLRLVFSVYHARLRCRQSFGTGCTPGKRRRLLDSDGGLSGRGGYSMAIMVAQTSPPTASRLGETTCRSSPISPTSYAATL